MKKIAIMQPYLFPYIGYWQLLNAVDEFVILDDVQYINRGWINRNRILVDGAAHLFSFSLRKASQTQNINERFFSADFCKEKTKFMRTLQCAYGKAPFFNKSIDIIRQGLAFSDDNISKNIGHSIKVISEYLNIKVKICFSSDVLCNKDLRGQEYILAINKALDGDVYINLSGGMDLYDKEFFHRNNLQLKFIKCDTITYQQFGDLFIPSLSIVDVIMFNSCSSINQMLSRFELLGS